VNQLASEKLRTRREALQLSLDDVSDVTRISVENLSALEEDRSHELPEGPYRRAFLRAYDEFLGQEEERSGVRPAPSFEPELPPPTETQSEPVGAFERNGASLRWVALVVGLLVFAVGAWRVLSSSPGTQGLGADAGMGTLADGEGVVQGKQELAMRALRSTTVSVIVDGESRFDGVLPGGQKLAFEGQQKFEVNLAAVGDVSLRYNGEKIVPLGEQDTPRKLVFIDDR
jgi:transcriptional regulator with XRE-family HTH domain